MSTSTWDLQWFLVHCKGPAAPQNHWVGDILQAAQLDRILLPARRLKWCGSTCNVGQLLMSMAEPTHPAQRMAWEPWRHGCCHRKSDIAPRLQRSAVVLFRLDLLPAHGLLPISHAVLYYRSCFVNTKTRSGVEMLTFLKWCKIPHGLILTKLLKIHLQIITLWGDNMPLRQKLSFPKASGRHCSWSSTSE